MTRWAAPNGRGTAGGRCTAEEPSRAGYAWYEALDRVTDMRIEASREEGTETALPTEPDGARLRGGNAERIELVLQITTKYGVYDKRFGMDYAFATSETEYEDGNEIAVVITGEPRISRGNLVDAMQRAFLRTRADLP